MSDTDCDLPRTTTFEHSLPVRVYWEDTDAGGIVYHASHVRFFERGRTEFLRALGLTQTDLAADGPGLLFAVRRMETDYLKAAKLDDLLTVSTSVCDIGGARLTMRQRLTRGDEVIATAVVIVVGITRDGRARRIPDHLRTLFGHPPHEAGAIDAATQQA
ncbi:MAG: tol-pal system-associated acyl-CoA thioesterase [Siculibacillus sp.]|nr:tol-pal system-associated acyl-CoA thioesterase [Siculibacillus sp.]